MHVPRLGAVYPGESRFLSSRNSAFTVDLLALVAYGDIYFPYISLILTNELAQHVYFLRMGFKKTN